MARPPIAPFLTLGAIFLFFLLRELYASYRHRTVQAKRQVDIAQIAAVHLPPPLPPLQAQLFDRAGPLSTFERAGATPGTWRAVGGVPIADEGGSHVVNVVATDADPDSAGVRGRMNRRTTHTLVGPYHNESSSLAHILTPSGSCTSPSCSVSSYRRARSSYQLIIMEYTVPW